MGETKQKERPSSSELARTAVAERQAEAKEIAEFLAGRTAAESPKHAQPAPMASLPEIARHELLSVRFSD
ncbi:MAG: hypothetical protein DMF76_23675 [Acidobacteria bacterium]|nr:MAG: hypothetical protein DMF76_23675 [Acidobacteriota bacterium]